ncbi:unnamed protein product [Cyclocybe aegerita]|uniref:F-box domain-containing protein n=1 Tax=Cyclocybe aegerita TaxID=1973307 RepID=A0A8S0XF42_CYCAE|nr:unnamed protein product [Cyclocybe aegerita]
MSGMIQLLTSPTPHLVETSGIPSPEEEERIREAIRVAEDELEKVRRKGVWYAVELMSQSGSADAERAQYLLDDRTQIFDDENENAESDISFLYMLGETVPGMFIAFIDQHKGLVSPIRRFPPELLVEIFSWVVQESPFPTRHSAAYPYELAFCNSFRALAFTHVCSYWRQVALSIPQLWTSIPFLNKIYLNESVWLPHTSLVEGDPADAASLEPLCSVLAHANRWSTAMIHVCPTIYESLPTLDFSLLHALNLRVVLPTGPDRIREGDYRGTNTVFQTTPMLKTLILDSKPMLPELDTLLYPLTTFVGLPVTVAYLIGCPELVKCEFRGPAGMLSTADPPHPFMHAGIRSFRLVNTNCKLPLGEEYTTTFFRWIKMPKLEVLEIEGPGTIEATTVVRELWGMTLAKPSLLRSFTFHVRDVKRIELLRLLEAMPLLEVLDIWDMPSASLKRLVLRASHASGGAEPPPPLVPCLHSLIIRDPSGEQSTPVDRDITIFLTYRRARGLARYQNIIEGWQEVEPGNHTKGSECTRLLGWANYLVKNFLGFEYQFWNPNCSMKKFEYTGKGRRFPEDSWDVEKIDKFLSVVEGHEMKDGRLLEMTRLNRIMAAIRDQRKGFPLGDEIFSFRARAGELVKKWAPLVEESAKGRRWQISEDGRTLRLGEDLKPRKIEVEVSGDGRL